MPPQQSGPFTDVRPSRSQIETLLSEVAKDRGTCQVLLEAFQAYGLLSGTEMFDKEVVDSQGRYQKARLMHALTRIDTPLRDQVIAVLEKLGGVSCALGRGLISA